MNILWKEKKEFMSFVQEKGTHGCLKKNQLCRTFFIKWFNKGKSTKDTFLTARRGANVLSQERGTIHQQKPSAGEMKRTFWRTLERTKATLTTVTCCVKIQNDCSELFEPDKD
jgi:hypothetical protein